MRHVLVTGAAHGIGAAIAERFAAAGDRVGLLDRDVEAVRARADAIDGAIALEADITDPQSLEQALDGFGAIPDVLVNNAGIVRFGPLVEMDPGDWRAVVDVNLTGTFLTARAVARRLLEAGRRGAIVNITSINGVAPGPYAGAYGATKAGVRLLTEQMALEWGPRGIRVNAVAPGLVDAGMSEQIYADEAVRRARAGSVPLGRLAEADDIARAVFFLASDDAAYVNGQNLVVDGGVVLGIIGQLPRPPSVDRPQDAKGD